MEHVEVNACEKNAFSVSNPGFCWHFLRSTHFPLMDGQSRGTSHVPISIRFHGAHRHVRRATAKPLTTTKRRFHERSTHYSRQPLGRSCCLLATGTRANSGVPQKKAQCMREVLFPAFRNSKNGICRCQCVQEQCVLHVTSSVMLALASVHSLSSPCLSLMGVSDVQVEMSNAHHAEASKWVKMHQL